MPEPFRLFVPPPVATDKLLLVQTGKLAIALDVTKVQEVLLKVSVISHKNMSVTQYQENYVPVILGQGTCAPVLQAVLVLMRTQTLKGGLVAIACSNMPKLVAISAEEWLNAEPLSGLWKSDGKAYRFGNTLYQHVTEIVKKQKS